MKRFSIPPREERERHSHTMSAYVLTSFQPAETFCFKRLKQKVSKGETIRFTPRNKLFHYGKPFVSRYETKNGTS